MTTDYEFPMFVRIEPRTEQFTGGRLACTDVLTLEEAATFASKHADNEITPADFLRAAGRGEIALRAIVHRDAKLRKHDGGIYCNKGEAGENTVPKGAIQNLPLSACRQLANAGCATWRTIDGFEQIDGELARFTIATLLDSEPDFETVPSDCRVTGYDAHALADSYAGDRTAAEMAPPAVPPGKPRATPITALLQFCVDGGAKPNIASVWLHISSNAGKPNFPIRGNNQEKAFGTDGKTFTKIQLERALLGFRKKANNS